MNNVPKLLDMLRRVLDAKNDSDLARRLGMTPGLISKLRAGKKLGDTTILRIHEKTGIPVAQIRATAGQPAPHQ